MDVRKYFYLVLITTFLLVFSTHTQAQDICSSREISLTQSCANPEASPYNLNLAFPNLANPHFLIEDGQFQESTANNGSATLTGILVNVADQNIRFALDLTFTQLTNDLEAKINDACLSNVKEDDFYYYKSFKGSMIGIGEMEGAYIKIKNTSNFLQLGYGANWFSQNFSYGAAAKLVLILSRNPKNGFALAPISSGDTSFSGHIAIELTDCNACTDTDGDGICDEEDCAPNDDMLPGEPGTECDDGDDLTINDVISAEGCSCLGEEEEFEEYEENSGVISEVCAMRTAFNTTLCQGDFEGTNYGGFLLLDGLGSHYSLVNGQLAEYMNGTARLIGEWVNIENNAIKFQLDVTLAGRTASTPPNSPERHFCLNVAESSFYYYTQTQGSLKGKDAIEGAVILMEQSGSAFQFGVGANPMNAELSFGATGALTATITNQPTTDIGLTLLTSAKGSNGAININLTGTPSACIELDCTGNTPSVTVETKNPSCSENTGEIIFKFANPSNQTKIEFSLDGGQTYPLTVANNEGIAVFDNLLAGSYDIAVRWENGECSTNLGITELVSEKRLPGSSCDDQNANTGNDQIQADGCTCQGMPEADICAVRIASNTIVCMQNNYQDLNYGGYLLLEGLAPHYRLVNGQLKEYSNGSALLTGEWINTLDKKISFEVNVTLSGRTTNTPPNSPQPHLCIDDDRPVNFYYYPQTVGRLTGKNKIAGAVLTISHTASAFQFGVGANPSNIDLDFGAAGWITATIISQPTTNTRLTLMAPSSGNNGGININLSGTSTSCMDNRDSIINTPCTRSNAPKARVHLTHADCDEDNGKITFSFGDRSGRSTIEFSMDGGQTYPMTVQDNVGTATFDGLGIGDYHLFVRWGNEECPVNLGTVTLDEITRAVGDSCDDGDDSTENDVIQADGCTCLGEIIDNGELAGAGDCSDLLSNPSFESGLNHWKFNANTKYNRSTKYKEGGNYIAWIYKRYAPKKDAAIYQDAVALPGAKYSFSFYAGTHRPNYNHEVAIEFYNQYGARLKRKAVQIDFDIDNGHVLKKYQLSETAPSGTTKIRFIGTASGDYLKLDAICVQVDKTNIDIRGRALADKENRPELEETAILYQALDAVTLGSRIKKEGVQLDWFAKNSHLPSKFIVEKSLDGLTFEQIDEVTIDEAEDLSILDEAPDFGTNYYRVIQQFETGEEIVSNVRAEKYLIDPASITIYPNPVSDNLNLRIGHFQSLKGTVRIFSPVGQQVFERAINKEEKHLSIDVSSYKNGLYFLLIEAENSRPIERQIIVENLE